MTTLFDELKRMADTIGDGASVTVQYRIFDGYYRNFVIFRVDWPNDKHFQYSMGQEQLENSKFDAIDMVASMAKGEYMRGIK